MTHDHSAGTSFVSSVIVGMLVALPETWLSYSGKVASVFMLAVVAELGRRLVQRLMKRFDK
jgi:hypothetical protein